MSARQIRPTGKRVLVRPLPSPERTTGGIVLAQQWQQPSGHAKVLAVGQAVQDIQPGDRVVYSWINGRDVEHAGEIARLLDEREVLAIVTEET